MNNSQHAEIELLLEIRDGISNSASDHVKDCEYCQQELQSLTELQQKIFADSNNAPPPEVWERIVATKNSIDDLQVESDLSHQQVPIDLLIANQAPAINQASLSKAIYSLAASILVTGFIGMYLFGQQNISNNQQNQFLQASIQELMLNSRGMERTLEKVALQSDMLSTAEQSAADRLYWRLTYVDQLIHENSADAQVDPARLEMLWNNRIEALTELNQIYYQRQQVLDESEI